MLLLIAMCLMLFKIAEGMSTIYVTPNVTTNQCPGTPCLELNTYASSYFRSSSYFLSTSEFIILPGTHFLDSHVTVANIDNLQMIGSPNLTQYPISVKVQEYGFDSYDEDNKVTYLESSTYIICTSYNDAGFVFVNITNLTIVNITFVNCGVYSNLTDQSAGIHMVNVHNLLMEGVSIQNSTGYGLLGVNLLGYSQIIKSSFIGNNQFIKNELNKQSANNFKCNGKSYTNNTIYYGNGDVTLGGGNMAIKYQNYGDYKEDNQIEFSALVLGLGIDSFFNDSNRCDSSPQLNYQGTGLSFILNQNYYINVTIQNSIFYRNQAWCGANMYVLDLSANFDISLHNVFIIRSMAASGAIYINYVNTLPPFHSFLRMKSVIFECNYAISDCSSLEIETFGKVIPTTQYGLQIILENCTFRSDYSGGNAILLELTSVVTSSFLYCNITDMLQTALALAVVPDGKASFAMNGCIFNDSGIQLRYIAVSISDSTFYNSHITAFGGATITLSGNVTFSSSASVTTNGGAIYLSLATIAFSAQSNVIFVNNSATYGGAIYMDYGSYLNYSSPTNVTFVNNTATLTGGAIYVVTSFPSKYYAMACFYQYDRISDTPLHVHVYFEGNFAGEAGSAIYGGDIDSCWLDYCDNCNTKIFDATHHFGYHDNTSSLISSDPRFIYVCPCDKGKCNQTSLNKTVYPGETIDVNLITIGQRYGVSPGAVFVYTDNTPIFFISALRSTNHCSTYHIQYKSISGSVHLATELSFDSSQADLYNITISILLSPCPAGFVMDNLNSSCICDTMLDLYVKNCSIDEQTLFKTGNAWIGSTTQGKLSVVDPCPSDYCTNASKIDVFNFNSQCSNNRVGVACGQCEGNLSMTFGTSQCKLCTNEYLLLIIPFAFMGMALIVFLMLFNFTVSSGTINGIILYAFVLRVFKEIYFPASSGAAAKVLDFLSVFIAWLNLDLGIETCFYDGMDSYSKVWLQFSFLLYMTALVVLIIVTSKLSSAMSRICRYNMIPVISTLVTLCYAKSLRIITTIFSFSTLESESSSHVLSTYVWYYDAAIPYLGLKHTFLFTAGLVVTIFFIVPYTAVMLLTPCLMSKSHWKVMFWMSRLKPFIDSYEAPFKDRYRFWTGATLFYRIVFCIVFSLFSTKQPTIVLLIIIVMHASMIVMAGLAIYKRWLESLLEGFFHINIVVYSLALFIQYSFHNKQISAIAAIACVGSAFICFLCILLFRMLHYIYTWKNFGHLQQYVRIINENLAAEKNAQEDNEILDYLD